MKLLTVMQRAGKDDETLGAFYVWLKEFAKSVEKLTVIAGYVGDVSGLPANVEVYSLGKEKGTRKAFRIKRYIELFSYHYAKSDAVLFQMSSEFVLAGAPFLMTLKKPVGLWYSHVNIPPFRTKVAEKLVDYIFTPTSFNFKLPSKKVVATGHAIDTQMFAPSEISRRNGNAVHLLAVGRISPVKNYETMVQACEALLRSFHRQWTLSIVGGPVMPRDHGYQAFLKRTVVERGLDKKIFFLGSRAYTAMPQIYRDHDIFLSMTGSGSFDRALLEAMASGLSVITVNGALKPYVSSQHFLEHSSPDFLAERIKKLADEPRPRIDLRNAVVEYHGIEKTIKKILTYLSQRP